MYNNSDGYIFIDLKGVDITKTNQYLKGIFNRVITVIDVNKLAIVINAGDLTPMAAIVRKRLNYYVITTNLYIFTINSNDIIIIEEAGETTVDVSIVPTLLSGIKVADFAIGDTEGSIYVPEQQTEINDNTVSDHTTWSSDKINTELSGKANSSDLATVATTGAYADLSGTPTIPVLTDLINDTTASSSTVYSSNKTDTLLSGKANSTDVYTKTEVDTALSNKADSTTVSAISTECTNNFDYTANETLIGNYFGIPLYRKYFEIGALPNNTTKTVEILDFTIRDVVDFRCIAKTTNNQSMVTLPYVSTQATFNILCDIECTGGKTKVNITTQMDRSGMVAFGIIDYLKWSN